MTGKNINPGKANLTDANSIARNMSKDPGVKTEHASHADTCGHQPGPQKEEQSLTVPCPQCGKSTLCTEFPDEYEVWIKCSSCGFFMGMSHDDWHLMQNSPNVRDKIKKMASQKGLLKG